MNGYPSVSPSVRMPEEFRFLCMLHNVGATDPERSLSVQEIARWTDKEVPMIRDYLQKLQELGYVQPIISNETEKYHVSIMGIRKVLTLYS
ncbi:hypothetical protein E3J51_03990 [Candidatus Bathyarchaeota archaeon]|nr:MAG: hypothetical protein E3J51_03990 [Candidatus Bathyarchaeota archaeon]